jgi:hypothetical protein
MNPAGEALLVGQDLGVGRPRVVIDQGVDVVARLRCCGPERYWQLRGRRRAIPHRRGYCWGELLLINPIRHTSIVSVTAGPYSERRSACRTGYTAKRTVPTMRLAEMFS